MDLQHSVAFDPSTEEKSFFDAFPSQPAVFVVLLRDAAGAEALPYLARTTDLRRRLKRLLGTAPAKPGPVHRPNPPADAAANTAPNMTTGAAAGDAEPGADSQPPKLAPRPALRISLRDIAWRVDYQPVGSRFEARWLLYQLNRAYYPRLYRQRLRLKPPALLKVNLRNRYPRCYPTRRISGDGSLYYGPFATRLAAERFAAEFLDLFKIRRCVEDLDPDPAHPGCIYSQMHMCLAPCFKGCTDAEYAGEVGRVIAFLDTEGRSLVRELETEREQASSGLDYEQAAKAHRRLDKIHEVLRLRPGLARNLAELNAVIVEPGAEPKSVVFFRVSAGELRGPVALSLDDKVSSPEPLDQQIRARLESIGPPTIPESGSTGRARVPASWEHLSLLGRWYYSSFREGELIMLPPSQEIPHAKVIRACRKILAAAT